MSIKNNFRCTIFVSLPDAEEVMQMVFQFPALRKILMRAGLFMSKTAKTEKGEMVIVILVTFRLLVPLKIII